MKDKFHRYSADSPDRRLIHVYITILSVLFAYGLYWFAKKDWFSIPWWFDAPAIFGFYGLLYLWFKKSLWRKKLIRCIFHIKTPDWNGEYKCWLETSYDNFSTKKEIVVKIIQDWDSILVLTETEYSISNSLSGSFSLNETANPQFTYEYLNKPKNTALDTMNIHCGMASIGVGSNKLTGEFFNGRGRNNYGIFEELP